MNDLLKKLAKISSANIVSVFVAVILGLVLPKHLSLEEYAEYKTFTLLAGYVGIVHFGYVDGVFSLYAGKCIRSINATQLKSELFFFAAIQCFVSFSGFWIGVCLGNTLFSLLFLSICFINILNYFRKMYQATDETKLYTRCLILPSVINLIITLFFLIRGKTEACLYIITYICSYCFAVVIECKEISSMTRLADISFEKWEKHAFYLIKLGWIFLLGNFMVNIFYGIDRIFIKIFFETTAFSYYSFAISMQNIVVSILQSVTIILYPYLARVREISSKIRCFVLVVGTFSLCSYFIFEFLVKTYIVQYVESLDIIAISVGIFPYMLYINSITINIYKIKMENARYFKIIFCMTLVLVVLNIFATNFGNYKLIAWSTFVCYLVWFYYSRLSKITYMFNNYWEDIYVNSLTVIFLVLANSSTDFSLLLYVFLWLIFSIFYIKSILKTSLRNLIYSIKVRA